MSLVKICGLRDAPALDAALAAGADMVGFVFFEASPRHVPLASATDLARRVERRALKVVLTVDADDPTLAAAIEAFEPDLVQMHGSETPERVAGVRARFGLPVMRALGLRTRGDLAAISLFEEVADHLLFDARPPAGASRPGGHGEAFDWSVLGDVAPRRPWLLAGGLHPGNVAEAIRATDASGVDVSSGVESSPGVKDADRIALFVGQARAAFRTLGTERPLG